MDKKINVPLSKEDAAALRTGDYVYLTGTVYTARDAAHKRMDEALKNGEKLPFDVEGNVIYYMGPSPAREGRPIGSAGPTTAGNRPQQGCLLCGRRRSRRTAFPVHQVLRSHCL